MGFGAHLRNWLLFAIPFHIDGIRRIRENDHLRVRRECLHFVPRERVRFDDFAGGGADLELNKRILGL